MEIHKPKPWHGAREFLKEYLVIVAGIVTALGGEQAVEALHWRHLVENAREAMAPGEARLLHDAAEREAQSRCLAGEFRMIQATLDRATATGTLEPVASIRSPARQPWTFGSYDAVVSAQVLPRFPTDERNDITSINRWSIYLQANRDVEVRAWSMLRTLEGGGRRISDAELGALRGALGDAMYQAGVMRGAAQGIAQRIAYHRVLSPAQLKDTWAEGLKSGAGPVGPCATRSSTTETEKLLHRLETPQEGVPTPAKADEPSQAVPPKPR